METCKEMEIREGVMMKEAIPLASWLDHFDSVRTVLAMRTHAMALRQLKTVYEFQELAFCERIAAREPSTKWFDFLWEHIYIDGNDKPRTLRECLEALKKFLIKCWLELRVFIVITRRETASSDDIVKKPLTVAKPKFAFPRHTSFPLPLSCHVLRMNNQLLL